MISENYPQAVWVNILRDRYGDFRSTMESPNREEADEWAKFYTKHANGIRRVGCVKITPKPTRKP